MVLTLETNCFSLCDEQTFSAGTTGNCDCDDSSQVSHGQPLHLDQRDIFRSVFPGGLSDASLEYDDDDEGTEENCFKTLLGEPFWASLATVTVLLTLLKIPHLSLPHGACKKDVIIWPIFATLRSTAVLDCGKDSLVMYIGKHFLFLFLLMFCTAF